MPINKQEAEIIANEIVSNILDGNNLVSELIQGVLAKEDSIRYPNTIAIEILSEKEPQLLYPQWDFFIDLLKSKNAFHRSTAIISISNLTKIDSEKKFEDIFDSYFRLLNDKSVVVTRKLAIYASRIVRNKPILKEKITDTLLSIDETQHTSSRKDLIKGDIIESISDYFECIEDKDTIIKFVKNQLSSSSPSTVKKAKEFLSKWN